MPFTYTEDSVVMAIRSVVDNAVQLEPDNFHRVPACAIEELRRHLGFIEETNRRARDLTELNKTVFEVSQSAANARPLCTLLHNLIFVAMKEAGSPGYQKSPQVRLVLHQLLHLAGSFSHPAYDLPYDDPRRADYGKDWDAVEELYFTPQAKLLFTEKFPGAQILATAYHTYDGCHRVAVQSDLPEGNVTFLFAFDYPHGAFGPEGHMDRDRALLEKAASAGPQPQQV